MIIKQVILCDSLFWTFQDFQMYPDPYTEMRHDLERPFITTAVRLNPRSSRGQFCMRFELIGCRLVGTLTQFLPFDNWRVYFQNQINPLLVLLRKTGFFDRIYTHVYGKTKFRLTKMYLRELSGLKFHSVTSSHVILYNDVKNSIFHQKLIYLVLEMSSSILPISDFSLAKWNDYLYMWTKNQFWKTLE